MENFVKSGQVLRIIAGALIAFLLMISGAQADAVGRAEAWFNNISTMKADFIQVGFGWHDGN